MRHDFDKESENTDRWLVSYADFITLLFAFFVVMYSVSQVNQGKFKILSETLVDAFVQPEKSIQPIQVGKVNRADVETSGDAVYPTDYFGEPATPESERAFEELREEFAHNLQQLIEADVVKLRSNEHWFAIDIRDKGMLFPGGSDELRESGRELIKTIAEGFLGEPNEIQIRGYTDSDPIQTRRFSSNWALSTARAVAVLELMQSEGIAPERMIPQGFGQYQPIAPNDTPEGKAMNRRIVIQMSKYPPAKSELERQAIEEATRQLSGNNNNETISGLPNTIQQTTSGSALNTQTNTQNDTPTANDPANIRLIRAPDGTLTIRAGDSDDSNPDDNQDDNSN